jgi:glycine/D-amino acid oxidase-like deaminating enzyme
MFDRESHSVELPGPPERLPAHTSVTIIGGGAMGVSTALHLARGGVGGIVAIERDLLGSGSSAKPLGGVRATFSDPGNILLAQPRSLRAIRSRVRGRHWPSAGRIPVHVPDRERAGRGRIVNGTAKRPRRLVGDGGPRGEPLNSTLSSSHRFSSARRSRRETATPSRGRSSTAMPTRLAAWVSFSANRPKSRGSTPTTAR